MYMWSQRLLLFLFLFSCTSVRAMLFDNRFFFLFRQPITRTECQPFHIVPEVFVMTADDAFDSNSQNVLIPILNGVYDQNEIAESLVATGRSQTNLMPPDFQGSNVLWNIDSKIEGQGIALRSSYRFEKYFEVGAGMYFMHARQGYEFDLQNAGSYSEGDRIDLRQSNIKIHRALGVSPGQWDDAGVGDAYVYGRIGNIWDYTAKFKRIDAGALAGILAPLGVVRDLSNPASLPFGGNGHTGIYGGFDAQFELKEDWVAGFELLVLKRLIKERIERFPYLKSGSVYNSNVDKADPLNYGSVVTQAVVDPGSTFYFAPYAAIERLRDGLGFRFIYHYINHNKDDFTTATSSGANVFRASELSKWGASVITANLIYDFGYYEEERSGAPLLSFAWNAPIDFINAKNSSKTHTISLTFEVGF